MKVLHISTSDLKGGASKGAYDLHFSMLKMGIDSQMLVYEKRSLDKTVQTIGMAVSKYSHFVVYLRRKLEILYNQFIINWPNKFSIDIPLTSGISHFINKSSFDLIHVHWINFGVLTLHEIKKIEKPVIVTFRDMWFLTGG